jgi:hypothetical protein
MFSIKYIKQYNCQMLAARKSGNYEYLVNPEVSEACGLRFDTSLGGRDNEIGLAGVTQLVECNLAKVDVAGSNPVSRSIPIVSGPETWVTECT